MPSEDVEQSKCHDADTWRYFEGCPNCGKDLRPYRVRIGEWISRHHLPFAMTLSFLAGAAFMFQVLANT